MSETPASILLIDDHPLLRRGIKQLISMEQDMEVVGEASNAADGIRMATEIEPDLILMDLNMPEMDRSEEHTSELQSRPHLVCRLLLEKKKRINVGTR